MSTLQVLLAGGFGTRLSEETDLRPKPKIKHNFYTLPRKVVRYIEEPYEGNLQVRFCEGHYATPKY